MQTITPSLCDYVDTRWHGMTLGRVDVVHLPMVIGAFAHQCADEGESPRKWAKRLCDVCP